MRSFLPPFWDHFKSRYDEVESHVHERRGSYKGLSREALYTDLEDLISIFKHPLVGGTFADLGCGAGISSLTYGWLFPERKSIGIEFEEVRIKEGRDMALKWDIHNASLFQDDLLSCSIPDADTYFLYFPTGPVLDRVLSELYEKKKNFVLVAIESHGDLYNRLSLENWLLLKDEVPLVFPRHEPRAKIFIRTGEARASGLEPFKHTYHDHFLLIQNDNESWIGDSLGMEWTEGMRFELQNPPRTIDWRDVKKLMMREDVPAEFHVALELRRLGELSIKTKNQEFQGYIRKIITHPSFVVEISTGEKVEWKEVMTVTQGSRLCFVSSFHS